MRLRALGRGPLVVKLAGLAGGVGLYGEEIESVARAGFRIAAVDTAGDRSDDPAPGPLTWDFLAGEVFAGLAALAAPQAILWGTSFGCLVALAAAARRPECVSGLLLCHPPDPLRRPRFQQAVLQWAEKREDPLRVARVFTAGFRLLACWEGLFPTVLRRMPSLSRAAAEAATPPATVMEKIRLLTCDPPGFPPDDLGPRVSVVASSWDTVTSASEARRLSERLPGAKLRILRFSGHCAAYSRPRAYARLVLEELCRIAGSERPEAEAPPESEVPEQGSAS